MEAAGQKAPASKPILEVEDFNDLSILLFEQATLADGGQLPEPAAFVQRLNRLLMKSA
jgi:molecular chaperone HtpG